MRVARTLPNQIMYSEQCPVCSATVKIFITGDPNFQRCWGCRSMAAYRAVCERLGYDARRICE